ncbi:MAG: hypothetical protein ACD_33C00014G0001 [uncultured bacterium]|nr:MAG: hypothetical protein ACD_33C00014G0001 [uncultured bacterium]
MQSVNYENLTTKDYMLLFTIRNEIKSEYIDFICYNEIFNYLENIINQFSIIRKKHLEATLCIDSIMLNKNNLLITTDLLIT